jgi:uncharacterized ferritin-like protein (DUF455 family)
MPLTLIDAACHVLNAADPAEKVRLSAHYGGQWAAGKLQEIGSARPPERPARPERPTLCRPGDMKRRRFGSPGGRIAFMHAIAHIELNAIDLAWDMVARFTDEDLPAQFYADWVGVAADEARHFQLLADYLNKNAAAYGDLPAHDGLWEAAHLTSDDILARLALVPLVLEARGLDTTPAAIQKLRQNGDTDAAAILKTIGAEEIPHVAAGVRWFEYICEVRGLEPKATYQDLVRTRFKGTLKAPFATDARAAAGFDAAWYEPLAG